MEKFRVVISDNAQKDIKKHIKSGNKTVINKIKKILIELENDPEKGIGNPEPLKYELTGKWSRRISQKDRMVYEVKENIVTVEVLSAMGHYTDK